MAIAMSRRLHWHFTEIPRGKETCQYPNQCISERLLGSFAIRRTGIPERDQAPCQRWCVTKLCVRDGMWQLGGLADHCSIFFDDGPDFSALLRKINFLPVQRGICSEPPERCYCWSDLPPPSLQALFSASTPLLENFALILEAHYWIWCSSWIWADAEQGHFYSFSRCFWNPRNRTENRRCRTGKHHGPEGRTSPRIPPKKSLTLLLKP